MAALNKRWVGTATTVPTTATNWAPIDLTKPVYKWTASGSGTNEYYMELTGGGDPGISAPGAVYINSAAATEGTVGSLTAGQWDYGDNDTLGYSTVYVRLSGGGDPDAQVIGYIQMYQIPVATDHVRIPAGSGAMTGVDWTGIALGDFIREPGHTGTIGSATQPLMIDPDKFEWSGTGTSYVYSIGAIAHDVRDAGGSVESPGLFLTGTSITTLTVSKGYVGLAWLHGQTSTVTTARVNGSAAGLLLGKGVSLTTSYVSNGALYQHCSATTSNVFAGKFYTEEAGTITTLNLDGAGQAFLNSTGTITTVNMLPSYTGTVDMLGSAEARTITELNHKSGTIKVDRSIVTITTYAVTDSKPQSIVVSSAA